jgi:hypothetical protein
MSSNIRIMKAISLDLYKRIIEGSALNSSITPPSSLLNRDLTYGTSVQHGGQTTSSSTSGLDTIPTEYLQTNTSDDPETTLTILKSIPDAQRSRARNLINAILPDHDFKWDATGRIIYRGSKIPQSNIVDLLSVATKSTKLRKLNIPALKEFMEFLKSINVPRHFLGVHFAILMDTQSTSENDDGPRCRQWTTFEQVYLEYILFAR